MSLSLFITFDIVGSVRELVSLAGKALEWICEKTSRPRDCRRNYSLADDITMITAIRNNKIKWVNKRKEVFDILQELFPDRTRKSISDRVNKYVKK